MPRINCCENVRVVDDSCTAGNADDDEPYQHDRTEGATDFSGSKPLQREEGNENRDRDGRDEWFQGTGDNIYTLKCAEHRNGRRDNPVAVEQSRTKQAHDGQHLAPTLEAVGPTSDISARMPPSPSLSARMMTATYLIDVVMMSVHTMSDSIPSAVSAVAPPPAQSSAVLKV